MNKVPQQKPEEISEVACPFCGLLCDDLVIRTENNRLSVSKNGCAKSKKLFKAPIIDSAPTLKGSKTSLESAIAKACEILSESDTPLFTGLGTDAGGMRQIMSLADHCGAVLDHMHGNALIRNTLVLQDLGWIMTTMAEIKNRADLIIFVGTDTSAYSRFFERVIWNEKSMFGLKQDDKEIVFIGEKLNSKLGISPNGKKPTVINCKNQDINEIISTIHALSSGAELDVEKIANIKASVLVNLAEKMKQAKYGVFVWAPAELTMPHAELTIQSMTELAKYLTRKTRFAGFTLGGNDGATTVNSLCTWQSGYPLRINFNKGYPEYDPNRYSTSNVLKKKEVDSMLWVSSFSIQHRPPKASIPSIILATPGTDIGFKADVFIPVSTPGLDHTGQLNRTDSVVTLPLKKLRQSPYPSVASVVSSIMQGMN
ncbi:MAG: formylmethanofuran dehydrogenase subunit B [Pseudomonadota bacterium]